MGVFDSLATLVTDGVNATAQVLGTFTTGDNAGKILGGVVVVIVVLVIIRYARRAGRV